MKTRKMSHIAEAVAAVILLAIGMVLTFSVAGNCIAAIVGIALMATAWHLVKHVTPKLTGKSLEELLKERDDDDANFVGGFV